MASPVTMELKDVLSAYSGYTSPMAAAPQLDPDHGDEEAAETKRDAGAFHGNSEIDAVLKDTYASFCVGKGGVMRESQFKRLGHECRVLDSSLDVARLSSIFHRFADASGSLCYDAFFDAMTAVAQEKYGHTDALARLVYFKLLRFGRKQAGGAGGGGSGTAGTASAHGEGEGGAMIEGCLSIPSLSPDQSCSSSSSSSILNTPDNTRPALSLVTQSQHTPRTPPSPKPVHPSPAHRLRPESPASSRSSLYADATTSSSPVSAAAGKEVASRRGGTSDPRHQAHHRLHVLRSDTGASPSVGRATMLEMHKEETKDNRAMHLSAHLLMSVFDHYADQGFVSLAGLTDIMSDSDILPSQLSAIQVRNCFRSIEEGGSGGEGGLDYGGLLRCLKACAILAFAQGGQDPGASLVKRMRQSLAHLLYDTEGTREGASGHQHQERKLSPQEHRKDHAASPDVWAFRRDAPISSEPHPAGAHETEGTRQEPLGSELEEALVQLGAEEKRALGDLAAEWTKKEVALRAQNEASAAALDRSFSDRIAANAAKYRATISRFRPSTASAELRARLRDGRGILSGDQRGWMEREIRAKDDSERTKHSMLAEREMDVKEKKIKAEWTKAKSAFKEETRFLEHKLMTEMEASFELMKLKYDARRRHAEEAHKMSRRHANASASATASAVRRTHSKDRGSRVLASGPRRPLSADPVGNKAASVAATARPNAAAGPAMSDLHGHLRYIFGNVFEAFIFLDVHKDHTVHRNQLRRQLPLLHASVQIEQVLQEIEMDAHDSRLDVVEFARHFSWHHLGPVDDQHAKYLQALKHRRRIVERVHSSLFGKSSGPAVRPARAARCGVEGEVTSKGMPSAERGIRRHKASVSSDDSQVPLGGRDLWAAALGSMRGDRTRAASAPRPRQTRSATSVVEASNLETMQEQKATKGGTVSMEDGGEDAVRVAELQKETKRLADQLLGAERLLAQKRRDPSKMTRNVRVKSEDTGKKKAKAMPEFVGPQGGYRNSDGLSALIRSDDTQTIAKYVTTTGLWFALPSNTKTNRKLPAYRPTDVHEAREITGEQQPPSQHPYRRHHHHQDSHEDALKGHSIPKLEAAHEDKENQAALAQEIHGPSSPQHRDVQWVGALQGDVSTSTPAGDHRQPMSQAATHLLLGVESEQDLKDWIGQNERLVRERLLESPRTEHPKADFQSPVVSMVNKPMSSPPLPPARHDGDSSKSPSPAPEQFTLQPTSKVSIRPRQGSTAVIKGPLDTSAHWDVSRETTPEYNASAVGNLAKESLVDTYLSVSEPYQSPRTLLRMPEPQDAGESSLPYELLPQKAMDRPVSLHSVVQSAKSSASSGLPPRDRHATEDRSFANSRQVATGAAGGSGSGVILTSTPVRGEWLRRALLGRDDDDSSDDSS